MVSAPVICSGLIALGLFLLQVVGVGTDSWVLVELIGTVKISAGLFRICGEVSLLGSSTGECYSYSNYATARNLVGFNYYASTGLSVIGSILLFVNVIISFVGFARSRPARTTLQNLSGIWFGAAGCSIASVIWFYITQFNDAKILLALTSLVNITLGYSFYLVVVAGVGSLIAAITMCVVARQMDIPQNAVPSATPAAPQVFIMHSGVAQQGPTGYPQAGNPQPGYLQPGNP